MADNPKLILDLAVLYTQQNLRVLAQEVLAMRTTVGRGPHLESLLDILRSLKHTGTLPLAESLIQHACMQEVANADPT